MSGRRGIRGRMPRVLRLAVGAAAVGVGLALTLRPFRSLDALTFFVAASLILAGLGEFVASADSDTPAREAVDGGALLLTGLVAALAPGLTVRGVAIVVGVGMVISGVARLAAGWRGEVDERYSSVVGGLAGVVFGIIALAWPDITILVVGLLVGPVAIVFGVGQMCRAVRLAGPKQAVKSSHARVGFGVLGRLRRCCSRWCSCSSARWCTRVRRGCRPSPRGRAASPTSLACCCASRRPRSRGLRQGTQHPRRRERQPDGPE